MDDQAGAKFIVEKAGEAVFRNEKEFLSTNAAKMMVGKFRNASCLWMRGPHTFEIIGVRNLAPISFYRQGNTQFFVLIGPIRFSRRVLPPREEY